MKITSVFCVAAGGAVGAVFRYFLSLAPFKSDFPLQTLLANLLGAVIIGFIAGFAGSRANMNALLFLKTGLCGGFTTFSTFSLETVTMLEHGRYPAAAAYILISLTACILGVFAGMTIGRQLAD